LGAFNHSVNDPDAKAFVKRGGDLNALPARVGIEIAPSRLAKSETIYSEAVALLAKRD
jgi:hypothetical protein